MTRSWIAQSAIAAAAATMLSNAVAAPGDFEHGLRRTAAVAGEPADRLSLAERMAYYKVPGVSVAIVDDCRIVELRAYGVVERGGRPVNDQTKFQAASISKPVTAFAAMRLVERGVLSLDADVRTRLKGWTLPDSPLLAERPVTLRALLSHAAGFNVGGFAGYAPGSPLPTAAQILDGVAPANNDPVRLQTAPGTKVRYSGGGYVIAQQLMSDATQQPFATLMHKLVIVPARMSGSTYEQPLPERWHANAATGHDLDGVPFPERWHVYPELGAAGLWTTSRDLARFALATMHAARGDEGAVIERSTAAQMLTPQLAQRGLGWVVEGQGRARRFSHGGTNHGYGALVMGFPATCQGAVVLTNGDGGRRMTEEVMRAIADAYDWPDRLPSTQHTSVALTPAIIERYVGTYRPKDRPDIPFDIVADGKGGLTLAWTRRPAEPLRASTNGLFALDSGVAFTAKATADGRVRMLAYGAEGAYEAERVSP